MIEKYLNRIIEGDALEVLRSLPDNSVDAVITDPPVLFGRAFHRTKAAEHRR